MKLLTLLCAAALAVSAGPARAATISFSPSSGTVSGTFTVDVKATDLFAGRDVLTDGIITYGFNVGIGNLSVLSFLGATSGPLFDPAGTAPGTDVFAAASGLGIFPPVTEPLLLATLSFKVVGSGSSTVTISSDLNNAFQGLQFVNTPFAESISGRLSFDATAVPEPASFALAGLALAGLAAVRLRRR